jgi:hypothetical protein
VKRWLRNTLTSQFTAELLRSFAAQVRQKMALFSLPKTCSVVFFLAISSLAQTIQPATPQPQSEPESSTPAPLPEQAAFLKLVAEKGDRYALLRQDYICRTNVLVKPSQLAKSQAPISEDYESFYVNGKEIHRILAFNGKPLSEEAKAEEDARLQKDIQATAKSKKTPVETGTLESAVLANDIFTGETRIFKDGRSYISFHFQGNHHTEPKSILEVMAKYLQGDVLIDEKDLAIVAFHGTTQEAVIYNNELLIPAKYPALIYEAKRINDEIYVPSLVTIAVAGPQEVGTLATNMWKRSLEVRTYTVDSCRKYRVTSTILPVDPTTP